MTAKAELHPVKVSASFEASLQDAERFLIAAGQPQAFDTLLDELLTKIVPNLGRFPLLGRALLDEKAGAVESLTAQEALKRRAGHLQPRQYVSPSFLLIYAAAKDAVYLLNLRYYGQLSFDLESMWLAGSHSFPNTVAGE
ncbi:hypothetical protein [Ottowia thiooxydans]|uniref:hypothetical protein n=1 Tax=Ottowia thiooxydans TaxID=219182 RepID=UPI0004227A03|nr:hypothetical protein [Ottowia thiooxydans]